MPGWVVRVLAAMPPLLVAKMRVMRRRVVNISISSRRECWWLVSSWSRPGLKRSLNPSAGPGPLASTIVQMGLPERPLSSVGGPGRLSRRGL
jgi:hypothetical protein